MDMQRHACIPSLSALDFGHDKLVQVPESAPRRWTVTWSYEPKWTLSPLGCFWSGYFITAREMGLAQGHSRRCI